MYRKSGEKNVFCSRIPDRKSQVFCRTLIPRNVLAAEINYAIKFLFARAAKSAIIRASS